MVLTNIRPVVTHGFRRVRVELPLSLGSDFFKGHGHGNDYLVFEEGDSWLVTPEAVQVLCHRTRGVGSDGIVALLDQAPGGTVGRNQRASGSAFRLRMFNPDGSEFERSGNGLRILASYLYVKGRVSLGNPFEVAVGGDTVTMEILEEESGGLLNIAVDMGTASLGMKAVGGESPYLAKGEGIESSLGEEISTTLYGPHGAPLEVCPVSVGNPHCVVFRPKLQDQELLSVGPFLTGHTAFPNGVNVQLATVLGPADVQILIWERGVGRTASSGTSACAVAVAGVGRGLLQPGTIRVGMEGGEFSVTVSDRMRVRLEGPVQPLCTGTLRAELVARL